MAIMSIADALRTAIKEEMRRDPAVYCMGEDEDIPGGMGGAFTVTKGIRDEFGAERCLNTPIAEIAISGMAVGSAMIGMRPVADIMYNDFLYCMMDQLANQAAKMCYMSGGKVSVPMVMRCPAGASNYGAQHGQSIESLFTHIPGLKIICPSTAYDAKGLLKQAIRDDNPVLCIEHKLLYGSKRKMKGGFDTKGEVPEDDYTIPFGQAAIRREGKDVTIVANLLMSYRAQIAAEELAKDGISCEIIDPRTLIPFDYETVVNSLKKTGKLMIVHEDNYNLGWGAQLASYIAENEIFLLDAPIKRVASYDVPMPYSVPLEDYVVPSVERIKKAIKELVEL